ncbi:MAG: GNAT family N-acetyltransferase, partial [Candidatus Fimenecus sp.]|nr:GNAT family N-acetyltransferase [Candidatus Fimenecus sp.]
LTCKDKLLPFYARLGFVDEGVTDKSTHGNAVWHQMRIIF